MKFILPILLLILFCTSVMADVLKVGNFSAGDLSNWTDELFKGKTSYTLVKEEGRAVLRAHSRHAASGLIHKVSLKSADYPVLRWSWKVERTLKGEDVKKKKGDDFAARVYVVFPRPFWRTRAINYVWSANMPKEAAAPSPYTSKVIIIAAESGDGKAGKWVTEERNVFEDYRKQFGEDPPDIGAVALMTDTDDTGEEVTAWYGDIFLESGKARPNVRRQIKQEKPVQHGEPENPERK